MESIDTTDKTATSTSTVTYQPLYVTHVEALGPYLKISGQLNPDAVSVLRTTMMQLLSSCYIIDGHNSGQLQTGTLCIHKRNKGAAPNDCELKRARVLKTVVTHSLAPHVEVEFVDYGYSSTVAINELYFSSHSEVLQNIPTLGFQFIVLGICKEWKNIELEEISRIIMHQTLDICIQMEFKKFKFIAMKWKEFSFAEYLIHQKKIGAPIANDLLRDNFIKMIKQQQQQQQTQQQQQQQQTQQQHSSTNGDSHHSNNTNNTNSFTQNNNNNNNNKSNYYNHTHLPMTGGQVPNPVKQAREQLAAKRSLAARLQQHKHPQQLITMAAPVPQNYLNQPVQPRMPQSIGNLRSMMQGIHLQNNRIPYTGLHRAGLPFGGMPVMPLLANYNFYNARQVYPPQVYTPRVAYQQQQHIQLQQQHNNSNNVVASAATTISPIRTTTATFKSNNLIIGQIYDVYVSFVENGPCLFSVQLASAQDALTQMMTRIEHVQLKQLTEKPIPGRACIARYSEDGQLYRALITGIQPTSCKVVYIDYGNAEIVNIRDLYEIPNEFLEAKVYAIRFTLSGHKDLEPIDESLKKAFKDLVSYKHFKLKVMPLEGPPLVQYCELYTDDKNIFDILKQIQKSRLSYAKAESLKSNDIVEIRYIDSPKHFYVQKVSNISKFEELMDDMFLYYNKNQVVPNHLPLGSPCIVKYENEWYRAEVMRADATAIIVRHIDFGYEQKVTKNLISSIAEKHLKLPRQAVQCCLKGFENNEFSKDLATTQFEMLAEESNRTRRAFTVRVFRIQPDGVNLVNLCTKDLNVMKKLFKLSMPFEEYLTLEKEEFKIHNGNHNKSTSTENGQKTPSIASSSEVTSIRSNKKGGNILNSTSLDSEERMQQQQHQQQQMQNNAHNNKQQKAQQLNNSRQSHNTSQNSHSIEWDKNSSASSMDNRDSRSSSSEFKQGKQRHQQQQQQQQQRQGKNNMLNVSGTSSDRRSTGSVASSGNNKGRPNQNSAQNAAGRQQNTKQENDNRRGNKQAPGTPQQQRAQRPQNAPQGYSQQRNKQTNNASPKSPQSGKNVQQHQQNEQPAVAAVVEEVKAQVPEEYVPLDQAFPCVHIDTPAREDVLISWWISPHQFYTHLKSRIVAFEQFMADLQQFYRKKTPQHLQLKVGSYVVARYRKENTVYRARILACNQMLRKYKVHFVDVGNQYTVTSEDIWQVEKRFASFPSMAHLCSFSGIVSNYDHLYIIDRMEKYLPAGAALVCEYVEREEDMYYVNVKVNKVSLQDTLQTEGFIKFVSPELRLDLLAGQQIRAKISAIKDMLNFKIQIEGCDESIKLLCCYDDVRYVKSNSDVAQKFKQFYEGKSCVVNIKDVNDNKVILLRPLMPLLKDDIPSYICTYPRTLEKFDAQIVHVGSAHRLFAHMSCHATVIGQLLDDMYAYYEKGGILLNNVEMEQTCAAKSSDGNWYRARIVASKTQVNGSAEVYFIDYGNKELVDRANLKKLDEKFYVNQSAYAIEINIPIRSIAEQHPKNKGKQKNADENEANVIKELTKLLMEQAVSVKALMVRNNRLIADITVNAINVVDHLKQKQLIKGRDVEYMRKQLDKEKPNMLEYIEMVDLTLEDEDDALDKKQNRSKNSTPKKKKPTKADVKTEKVEIPTEVDEKPATANTAIATVQKVPIVDKVPEVAKIVTLESLPVESEVPIAPTSNAQMEVVPEPVVDPYADMEQAVLSHCDNPAQFFVHLQVTVKELQKLQETLQIVASSFPPVMRVNNGTLCISFYSVDKQWYRARIMDAELMVLKFIDYGNTDCVSDTTDVKEMIDFQNIEPLCMPCALPIRPNGTTDWVDAANTIFNDSYTKVLYFEYITRGDTEKRSFINLFIDGVNIAEKLIEDGYAKPLELVNSGENCYISHVNTISDFYIQYEKDSKALELIEMHLADNEKLKKLEKFERSKIVAALFPDDEMWYRAKLLREVPERGYEVLFIDYGNTSVSRECREIAEDIAKLPPLSKKCALELPDSCVSWSDAAEDLFAEIAGSGETTYTVELREPAADHAVVHLLIDGRNVNDDLEPLCEHKPTDTSELNASFNNSILQTSIYENGMSYDAVVSHVNTPWSFYVQFNKDVARLEDITTTLNELQMNELKDAQVGQLCAAVFNEDNVFYRARVLETIAGAKNVYRVIFIDYGNEAVSEVVRELPEDLQQIKEFSKHCQIEKASTNVANLPELAITTFNAIVEGCAGAVKVDFVDCTSEPAIVKLRTENTGENVHEKLGKLLSTAGSTPLLTKSSAKTCLISHAESPSNFYIQLKSNTTQMDQIAKALLKANVESMPKLTATTSGTLCSAYSQEDDCYYRGRIERELDANAGYEIFLLDFGNTLSTTKLHEMPQSLQAIPALALKCRLNAIPNAAEAVLVERFNALLEAHFGEVFEIDADEVDAKTGVHTIKLQANYKCLADELATAIENGAANEEATEPVLYDCSIIHVNSPSSFYIQLSQDIAAVEKITDVLLDAEIDFPKFTDLRVGVTCAAQFPEDEVFYRAEIVQVLEDGKCEVHYLDFGNNSITDQFRQLPVDLITAERYSKHCTLDAKSLLTPDACAHFQSLVDSRISETFQVEFLKTTDTLNICRLFYQNKNVANEVTQLLKGETLDVWKEPATSSEDDKAINPSSGVCSMDTDDSATIAQ